MTFSVSVGNAGRVHIHTENGREYQFAAAGCDVDTITPEMVRLVADYMHTQGSDTTEETFFATLAHALAATS